MSTGSKPRRGSLRARATGTLEAGVAASLVLGKLSCPASGPSPTLPAETATVAIPLAQPEIEVPEQLRADAVLSTAPARRTLFTWTTREQVEALARDRVLLTRSESPVHGPAFYDQVVAARAASGDALASKLRTAAFARARHAWVSPWATLLGWPGESYGDELIAVQLKPEAWTLKLTTSTMGWEAFDGDNRPVDLAEVLLHPERIGAVYFVHDAPSRGDVPGGSRGAAFREYVLCNEAMIERWEIGSELVAQRLQSSAELAARLADALAGPTAPPPPTSIERWNADVARAVWPGRDARPSFETRYDAALAFPNELYALSAERMRALSTRLRAITVREPRLSHVPTVTPAAVASASASARALPPPVPKKKRGRRVGTWGTF
jgi:hypothetical protein